MAKFKLCSIPNCGKPYRTRGWCSTHYQRWCRYGDPLGGGTFKGEPLAFLNETVLPYGGKSCLVWPYSKSDENYGSVKKDGKTCRVHRLVCEETHGPAPSETHEAAHPCGNSMCVNPNHLRWATHVENMADTLLHGTHNRGVRSGKAKLTEDQVREIRAANEYGSVREISRRLGISEGTAQSIRQRRAWAWLE